MTAGIDASKIAIVLHRPRYPENIGAAARAMCNMGFEQLVLVEPQNCDLTRIAKMATHAALDVVEQMLVYDSLEAALAEFNFVAGMTARLGGRRRVIGSPKKLAATIAPLTDKNRIALVFGPEDRGLTNADARLCHVLVNIPTGAFSSLNLAQAVMIICYELFVYDRCNAMPWGPRLASRRELDGMYAQLKEILIRICYINPDNPDYFMNNLRHFFTRLQLQAREVSIIRGICRQIDWYGQKCCRDGREGKGG